MITSALAFLLLVIAAASAAPVNSTGQCIWYGACHKTFLGKQNCVYNGPPKPINKTTDVYKQFLKFCPKTAADSDAAGGLCCNEDMISTMLNQVKTGAGFLKSCPSCDNNFYQMWCESTCSPIQSTFLQTTKTEKNDKGQEYVTRLNYWVTDQYVKDLFDSCHYTHAGPGFYAMTFLCGGKLFSKCTYKDFINYMGGNPLSPFPMDFQLVTPGTTIPPGIVPLNDTNTNCGVSPGAGQPACSCSDCPSKAGCH